MLENELHIGSRYEVRYQEESLMVVGESRRQKQKREMRTVF